jgi:NADH-quinone oxidoreductase subunit H
MPTSLSEIIEWIPPWLIILLVVHFTVLGAVAYMILLERKVASWVQDRLGPNRVGLGFGILPGLKDFHFWGLGQPLADGIKFILKEDYRAKGVDKVLFTLAPCIMIIVVIISIAVIPWGGIIGTGKRVDVTSAVRPGMSDDQIVAATQLEVPWYGVVIGEPTVVRDAGLPTTNVDDKVFVDYISGWYFQIANVNIGVLFVLATLSLAVYGVVIGGWASNNKYSFLGGLRACVNMISYEIPLGLCILVIVLMYGTLDLAVMVERQVDYWWGFIPAWNVFTQPLCFLLFLICIHAEANRAPFDLAEAEQELVGGYHTEYSSMRFALFFLAEYAGMITTSCVLVALFFGGWHVPGLDRLLAWMVGGTINPTNPAVTDSIVIGIVRALVFFTKALVVMFVFMWVRWSLPRFRFDQLIQIAWKGLIPMTLALVVGTAIIVYVTGGRTFFRTDESIFIYFLTMNIMVVAATMIVYRMMPAGPEANRRSYVVGSRFRTTPVPATVKA